ncbi:hypothetical protein [Kingella oralis]|jgi:hypothetical protein|uniref:hypothetical protein n=1 Tax=Kingella oralis TaxID=505 RepID=UPI00206E1AEB|nr:MAG TPA: putative secreted protein [Caudoviricetes sp.]DAN45119.1 MAG TPA: putative secreted protein [Caudoviricetes sp.]DAQ93011.1 MAG TPA: putative secreted protein [Caudoviricetes sp.]
MKRYTIVLGALAALSLAAPAPEITLKQPSRPQPHPLGSVTLRKHRHSGVAAARRAKRRGKRQ